MSVIGIVLVVLVVLALLRILLGGLGTGDAWSCFLLAVTATMGLATTASAGSG